GSSLGIANDIDWAYYNNPDLSAREIMQRSNGSYLTTQGQQFIQVLNKYVPFYDGSEPLGNAAPNAESEQASSAGGPTTDTARDSAGQSASGNGGDDGI